METVPPDLARRYGTPLYVYRRDRLRQAAADLRAVLPEACGLYYSVKANPHPGVVGEFVRAGLDVEISSVGELASVPPVPECRARALYTGPGKTSEEIAWAIRQGVRRFSVESVVDHRRLLEAADECRTDVEYLIRLNGGAGGGSGLRMTGRSSQFGVDVEDAPAIARMLRPVGRARPAGVHVFAASNVVDEDVLIKDLDMSAAAAGAVLASADHPLDHVDLGGGFAAPFAVPGRRPSYSRLRAALEDILDRRLRGWRDGRPWVTFESGRYLTADSGTLVTTVLDVKRSRGTTYAVLDAGTNALGGMWGLGRLLTPSARTTADDGSAPPVTLVGPLCTPLDVLSRAARVPQPRVDSVVEIPNVGAYGLTASLVGFLSRPVPTELIVEADGEVVSARRLELRATTVLESDGQWRESRASTPR
jgi:diaminopimelate decarboxylase